MKYKHLFIGAILLLLSLVLVACSSPQPAPTAAPVAAATLAVPACPTAAACPTCPEAPACPTPVVKDVPNEAAWVASPHNQKDAEAFNHWNEADPAEVPTDCARCHSTTGMQDFMGADGSPVGTVEKAAPIGETVECVACHNSGTAAMTSVTFPSGAEVKGLTQAQVCMECHQGRASSVQVNEALDKVGATTDLDTPKDGLGFINIHYFPAAATLYGTVVKGGYEYEGKAYDAKNDHVAGFDTCIGCHDQHSLEVRVESCAQCHQGVTSTDDLKNVRMNGSAVDYDGDGNVQEGISFELEGVRDLLYQAIQGYAKEVAGTAIAYTPDAYPYFFIDTNGNGQVDTDEANSDNAFKAWTGRLLKAAYNYQLSVKDPGAFAHGGKYIIELLYDSTEDLNTKLATPVDLSKATRIDAGHFAGSEEAFRHWDTEGEVPGTCAKCHSATGLPTFIKEGVNVSAHTANGLNCATCHDDLSAFTRYQTDSVKFPSGETVTFGEGNDANLCLNCHQGRESTNSMNNAIKANGATDDEVSDKLAFRNPHYFAAGATLFGTEVKGAYEYTGQKYDGRNMHVPDMNTCVNCHGTHSLEVQIDKCAACHTNVKTLEDLPKIRMDVGAAPVDYDGDGNTTEGIGEEVATMKDALLAAIQAYAKDKSGAAIAYNPASYPYFFADTNGNGTIEPEEASSDNAYKNWTPRLLRAAYNYQWVTKDPGVFAHNGNYILQVLYDSLKDVGGSSAVSGMTRAALTPPPAQ